MSHHLVSALGLVLSFLGQKRMIKLNPERYSDHLSCQCMRFFGCSKILQVLVIIDHIDQKSRAFEVMSLSFESFKNCEELFVVDIVVEFQSGKGPGVECNGVQFAI